MDPAGIGLPARGAGRGYRLNQLRCRQPVLVGGLVDSVGVVRLIGYLERGEIKPLVAEIFPLHDIVAAQEAFLARKHTGKIVLIPKP